MLLKLIPMAVLLIATSAIFGCGSEPPNNERVPMPTGNPGLREQLLSELDRRDIWYNELSASEIEIELENTPIVGGLFDGMIKNVLPEGRSISPSPDVLPELIEALNDEGVTCATVRVFEKDWLVCDGNDMLIVEETLTRIVTES